MSRLKQLGKDSLVYGLGGIISKSISFITLPILTNFFSPTEYGTIEMIVVISSFLSSILVMGMDSAQSMYFFKIKEEGKHSQAILVSSILQWRLIWGSFIVLTSTLLAPYLNSLLFDGRLEWIYFAVAFIGTLFTQIMYQSTEVLRLLYRPWSYIFVTTTQSILSTVLILLFVLYFDEGILGYFIGLALSSVLVSILGWTLIREYIVLNTLNTDLWPLLLRFGAPLVPAGLSIYLMSTADRWFIQYYLGPNELGIYAVGSKFALLFSLVVETFRKAWWPIAMDSMNSDDGPDTFRMIARMYFGVCSAGVIILSFISPFLVQNLTGIGYHSSWPLVGVLALQAVFYGLFMIVSAGIWKGEKTYLNLPIMFSAVVISIALNWLLVPNYGSMGAAIATVITYFFWVILSMVVSELYWKVGYDYKSMIIQLILVLSYLLVFIKYNTGNFSTISIIITVSMVAFLFIHSVKSEIRTEIFCRIKKCFHIKY